MFVATKMEKTRRDGSVRGCDDDDHDEEEEGRKDGRRGRRRDSALPTFHD